METLYWVLILIAFVVVTYVGLRGIIQKLRVLSSIESVEPKSLANAARDGDLRAVKLLLEQGVADDERAEALYMGVHSGAAMTRLLLDAGTSANARHMASGRTPLHLAAVYGYLDVVALLVERGSAVNSRDGMNRTPLWCAINEEPMGGVFSALGGRLRPEVQENKRRVAEFLQAKGGVA